MSIQDKLETLKAQPGFDKVTLVAVSKTHPVEIIQEAYEAGQRHFGENKVQELMLKKDMLPYDIHWHLIGHLQTNKVKFIAPFIHLIHSVDSQKLLQEIDKEARKAGRVIDVLLQIYIAREETKYGLSEAEAEAILDQAGSYPNVRICGLMGMASNTEDTSIVRREFRSLKTFFDKLKTERFADARHFNILSMGMSSDYALAIEEGSTLVRVGSAIFGVRDK